MLERNQTGHTAATSRWVSASGVNHDMGEGMQPTAEPQGTPTGGAWFLGLDVKFLGTEGDANDSKCFQAVPVAARAAGSREVVRDAGGGPRDE